jgi:hypothetical protein
MQFSLFKLKLFSKCMSDFLKGKFFSETTNVYIRLLPSYYNFLPNIISMLHQCSNIPCHTALRECITVILSFLTLIVVL